MTEDYADLVDRTTARAAVRELRATLLDRLGVERIPLGEAVGRTLAEPVVAGSDAPPRDFATMDGFALAAGDDYPLSVVDSVYPEDDPPTLDAGEAVRIATGAPLPDRADAVLRREEAETTEEGGTERLRGPPLDPGTYVHGRGTNIAAGERLFDPGEVLAPRDALLLGDLGRDAVPVRERPSVGLLATGTEIHEGRSPDLDSPMLAGLVRSWGGRPTHEGSVPDDPERTRDRVAALADAHDVVMTTGGTSVGDEDHAVRALRDLGDLRFHRVRLRPGKPLAVADLPDRDAVGVAVPGKPVGAHAVTTLVVRPLFRDDPLATVTARFARDVDVGAEGFDYAVPVTLDGDDAPNGPEREAFPLGHADSPLPVYRGTFDPSVLSASTRATRADGFVLTREGLAAGERVEVVPYPVVE